MWRAYPREAEEEDLVARLVVHRQEPVTLHDVPGEAVAERAAEQAVDGVPASADAADVTHHLDGARARHEAGPRTISALRRLLADVRRTGHAVEDGEVTPGFASVAVAVLDHARHPVAGVAVTFPCAATPASVAPSLLAEVARTARAITARIGG